MYGRIEDEQPASIYGHGEHDVLQGGSGDNYIRPNADGDGGLASIQVENYGTEPGYEGYYANGGLSASDFTYDGNMDENGSAALPEYAAGYGGLWNFHDLGSGARLGEDDVTPVAVYVTWRDDLAGWWTTDAVYTITGTADGLTHVVNVNQQTESPGHDYAQNDRPWRLLGVYNVNAGQSLQVAAGIGTFNGLLCVSDVMVRPLWPTVSIRTDANGDGNFDEKDDWLNSWNLVDVSAECDGPRTQMQLTAAVDALFAQAPHWNDLSWDWVAKMPAVAGVNYYGAAEGDSAWQGGRIIPGHTYTSDVWVSTDPNSPPADTFAITFKAYAPPGAGDAAAAGNVVAAEAKGVPVGTPANHYRGTGVWPFKNADQAKAFFDILLESDRYELPRGWLKEAMRGCIGLQNLRVGWKGLGTPDSVLTDKSWLKYYADLKDVVNAFRDQPAGSYAIVAARLPAEVFSGFRPPKIPFRLNGFPLEDLTSGKYDFATWFPTKKDGVPTERSAGYWEFMNHHWNSDVKGAFDDPKHPPTVYHRETLPSDAYIPIYTIVPLIPWPKKK